MPGQKEIHAFTNDEEKMAEESFTEDREKEYQERQKLLAELNKLREKNEELEYYVKNISTIDFPKINLSEASDWLVENERKAGVDIKGYKHQVAKNFVYHTLNKHGDAEAEKLRGNAAVTKDDITNLKEVFENPDLVAFGLKRNGEDLIAYTKKLPNGTSVYLEEILSGKKNRALRSKTLYKKAGEISKEKFRRIISSNPYNDCSKMNIALGEEAKSSVLRSYENGIGSQVRNPTGYESNISQNQNLSNHEKLQEEKTMPGQNTIHAFTDDGKKMSDFNELTKREFLDSHSDVNEADYDATVAELKEKGEYTAPWNTIKEIVGTGGKAFANEVQYQRELHQDDDYTNDADGNFMRKFDATYFAAEQNLSHRGLDMDTYRDLFGDISEEKATEIEDEKRDILGPEVVEELVKGPADINGPAGFEDFTDIQQAYDRALAKSETYRKIAAEELQQAIGKRDNLFVTSIADYLNSVTRHYDEKHEPETAKKCEDILSEALFTAETEINTEAFKTLLENGADITYRKTEAINGKEHKANILHYIAADDNIEALSLLMDGVPPLGKPFDRLTAGEKLSLLKEQNFEGRTPLEVSENYYREEPSIYEPDMVMPDVMRELAYQEENLMSHVPPLVLTDKLTGNILMVEQADGDVREVSLFDKNKKLVDHDISSGFRSSLEAARNNMAEYEKHGLWGNFYEYEKVPANASLIQSLKDSRDEFYKTVDAIGEEIEKNGIELYAVNNITPNFKTDAKFEMFIPGKLLSEFGIETEHGEPFEDKLVKIQMFIGKNGKEDGYHVDLAGNEDIQDDFTANAGKRFDAVIGKIQDKILEKYPYKTINQMIRLEEARHFPVMDRVDLRDYLNAHKTKELRNDFEYGFQRPDAILEMLSKQGKKLLFDKENDKIFEISKNADLGFSNIGTLSELEDVTAKQLLDEERGMRTVTQSVTFPAHFIMSEKQSLSLLEKLQDKYGFGENDFEKFVNDGDVDIHFAAPVPKEYQFPKSKTNEWVESVCNDLEKNFGSTDVAIGMDGSERTERVFETEEEARRFHKGGPGGAPSDGPGYYLKKKEPEQSDINLPPPHTTSLEQLAQNPDEPPLTAESIFKNFIKEANDEYKELKLIYQAAAKALKSTPPEQRKILDAELLKRGARSPEKLASIMQDAFRKLDEPEKWQKKSRADNSYDRGR